MIDVYSKMFQNVFIYIFSLSSSKTIIVKLHCQNSKGAKTDSLPLPGIRAPKATF